MGALPGNAAATLASFDELFNMQAVTAPCARDVDDLFADFGSRRLQGHLTNGHMERLCLEWCRKPI